VFLVLAQETDVMITLFASEMTYIVSSGALNSTHSYHSLWHGAGPSF